MRGAGLAIPRGTTGLPWPNRVLGTPDTWPRSFEVKGIVGHQNVTATWCDGVLHMSEELFDRAEVVVALQECFALPSGEAVIGASLDAPLAALLTLMRACDSVEGVVFGPD